MSKDKTFIISMFVTMSFVIGIFVDNIYTTIKPRPSTPIIDVAQVLKTIQKADLQPVEAKYYKILKRY